MLVFYGKEIENLFCLKMNYIEFVLNDFILWNH